MICPECGGPLEIRRDGSVIVVTCYGEDPRTAWCAPASLGLAWLLERMAQRP